jgi:glycosyltransferase involved in cell wall biosynthesis
MRIVFIIDSLSEGGKERRLVELIKSLVKKENISIKLILLTSILNFQEVKELGIEIKIIKRRIKKDPSVFFKIFSECRNFKPDIINTWGLMPAVYAVPASKILKIKLVNSMIVNAPESLDFHTKIFSSLVFPFSDVIASNSSAGLKSYNVKGKSIVIYNGFDFSRISNLKNIDEIRKELGVKTNYVAGMVAGFRKHKDYDTMITAANAIIKERGDITFVLVGDGPYLEDCRKRSLSGRIVFTGRRSDVESIMSICDIGILSTFTEGISNSILEFMALGKPVIATDGGGTKEIVTEGSTGFLIPQRSPLILADRIKILLDDQDLRKKLGAKSMERIINDFSMKTMTDKYYNLFKDISAK